MLASLSCSVLEDRSECLCHVEVFPGDVYKGEIQVSFWNGAMHMFSEKILLAPGHANAAVRTDLTKGLNRLCAVWSSSGGACTPGDDCLRIPLGRQMDSLYVYDNMMDCRGDTASDTVTLHKQFASLRIHFEKSSPEPYPYFAVVTSDVCGLQLPDFQPMQGDFEYYLYINEEMVADCRLPRQRSHGLRLLLYRNYDGSLAYVFSLAEAIEEVGYDWLSLDLDDVEVWVDCANGSMNVDVIPWDVENIGEICF